MPDTDTDADTTPDPDPETDAPTTTDTTTSDANATPDTDAEADAERPGRLDATIDTDAFAVALDALSASATEAVFRFTEDGLTACSVDPASVLLADVEIPSDTFDAYEASGLELGFDLERLRDLALVGDTTHLEWDTDDFKLVTESGPVNASMAAIAPDQVRSTDINDQVYDGITAGWQMPYDDLHTALSVTTKLSGSAVQLRAGPPGAFCGLEKQATPNGVTASFDAAEFDADLTPDAALSAYQSEEYLQSVRGAIPSDATIHCRTGDDWPLILTYTHEGVHVEFLQAPRLEDA